MQCENFILEIGGQEFSFTSEAELANFIKANKNRLKGLEYSPLISLSVDFSKKDEVKAKLLDIHRNTPKVSYHYNKDGERVYSDNKERIAVTKAIKDKSFYNDKGFVPDMNREEFFQLYREANSASFPTDEEFNQFRALIEDYWDHLGKWGTAIHKVAELLFSDEGLTSEAIYNQLKNDPDIIDIDQDVVANCYDYVTNVKSMLKARYGQCEFISEFKVSGKAKDGREITGIIDLLVIDENGNVHIFDFKTSPIQFYDKTPQIKQLTYDYQLEFYRQILSQYGLNMSNSDLGILPVQTRTTTNEDGTVKLLGVNTSPKYDLRNRSESITLYGQNSWEKKFGYNGYVKNNVANVLQSTGMSMEIEADLDDTIDNQMIAIFGNDTYANSATRTVGTLEEVKKKKYLFNQGSNGLWYVTDPYSTTKITKVFNTEKEAEDQMINWLSGREADRISLATNKARTFNEAKAKSKDNLELLHGAEAKLLNRYLREGWELMDGLIGHGVMVFVNDKTKNYEFVYFSKNDVTTKVTDFAYNSDKITGNLCSNREIEDYTLDAYTGNIDLMRLMLIVNEYMKNMPEGYKISGMKVASSFSDRTVTQPFNVLLDNFNQLINIANRKANTNIVNNFEGADAKLRFEDNIIGIINRINEISDISGYNSAYIRKLKETQSRLYQIQDMDNDAKQAELISELEFLTKNFTERSGDVKKMAHDIHSKQEAGSSDVSAIVAMITDEIKQLQGMHVQSRLEDIASFNLLDSDLIQSVNRSKVEQTKELNRHILERTNAKIRERMSEEASKARKTVRDYMKAKHFIVGANNNYDHLVDRNGGVFRVIDPKAHPELTATDKAFLEEWLTIINAIRFPTTKGDRNHPDAKTFVLNGEWFDIPLVDGGFLNQVKSSKGAWKGLKDYFSNKARKAVDPLLYHEEGEGGQKEIDIKRSRLEKVSNPMNLNSEVRTRYLESQGVDMFSRDLGDILVMFTANNIIYDETNKALPIMKAIALSAYLDMEDSGVDTSNVCQYLVERMKAEAYDINLDDYKKLRHIMSYLDPIGTSLIMAGNVKGLVKENALGVYNVLSRTMAGLGRQDMPSEVNTLKAYAYVTAKGAEGLIHDNFLYALDRKFNLSGFGTREIGHLYAGEISPAGGNIFNGNLAMATARIPDFIQRMTLAVAFMMEDGSFDAYSYDEDREMLVYNFDKDERFNKAVKNFKSGKLLTEGDKENLALYFLLLDEENAVLPSGQRKKVGDPLSEGISQKKLTSIRNANNQLHGTMDRQNRSLLYRYFLGNTSLKFMSYLPSKAANAWTIEGYYQSYDKAKMKDPKTGEQMYIARKINSDESVEYYYTSDKSDPNCTMMEALEEQAMLECGVLNSVIGLLKILADKENRAERWEEFKKDPYKMANIKLAAGDLLAWLLSILFGTPLLKQTKEDRNKFAADMVYATMVYPFQENTPWKLVADLLEIVDSPTVSKSGEVAGAVLDFITSGEGKDAVFLNKITATKYISGVFSD